MLSKVLVLGPFSGLLSDCKPPISGRRLYACKSQIFPNSMRGRRRPALAATRRVKNAAGTRLDWTKRQRLKKASICLISNSLLPHMCRRRRPNIYGYSKINQQSASKLYDYMYVGLSSNGLTCCTAGQVFSMLREPPATHRAGPDSKRVKVSQ